MKYLKNDKEIKMNYLIVINWALISYFISGQFLPSIGSILGLMLILFTSNFEKKISVKVRNISLVLAMITSLIVFLLTSQPLVATWIAYVALIKLIKPST